MSDEVTVVREETRGNDKTQSVLRVPSSPSPALDIDIEHCPNCGGAFKIIAAPLTRSGIEDPPVIVKILCHLGLPTRAPPRARARRVDLFQTI